MYRLLYVGCLVVLTISVLPGCGGAIYVCAALIASFRRVAALTNDFSLVMEAVLANPCAPTTVTCTARPFRVVAALTLLGLCCFACVGCRRALELRVGPSTNGSGPAASPDGAEFDDRKQAHSAAAQQPVMRSTDPAMCATYPRSTPRETYRAVLT